MTAQGSESGPGCPKQVLRPRTAGQHPGPSVILQRNFIVLPDPIDVLTGRKDEDIEGLTRAQREEDER